MVSQDYLFCEICNKKFRHLGSHIAKGHGITTREYKMQFNLPVRMALISDDIKLKKQIAFNKRSKKYLANLIEKGKKTRFKKNAKRRTHYLNKQYKSQLSLKTATNNLLEYQIKRKKELCPVCRMVFDNLPSHLYNKHRLMRAK